jgi:hypothetical protein
MKHKLLYQIVAILLLVFALSDIASSEPCNDELNGLNENCVSASNVSSTIQSATEPQSDIKISAYEASSEKSQSDHPHCVECFCCCPHILPSPMVKTEKPVIGLAPSIPFIFFLPSSPSKDTFRPPRFA